MISPHSFCRKIATALGACSGTARVVASAAAECDGDAAAGAPN